MRLYFYLVILFVLLSCSSDNFYETERYFETSKSSFKVNEEFDLTVIIESETEKTIRFYENFKNLTIWTSLRKPCEHDSTQWCNEGLSTQNVGRGEVSNILTYKISKDKPFIKSFKCKMEEMEGRLIFSIPDLEYYANYDIHEFDGITKIGIHGHCDPINPEFGASLEEYIDFKEIEIIHESVNQKISFPITTLGSFHIESGKLDSLHEYGAGDCWGSIRHYSDSGKSIAIDSMICSEYGFTYTQYYLEKGEIKAVHIQQSSTQIAQTLEERTYELTEQVYDLHEQPYKIYTRTGIYKSPDFSLIQSEYSSQLLWKIR